MLSNERLCSVTRKLNPMSVDHMAEKLSFRIQLNRESSTFNGGK